MPKGPAPRVELQRKHAQAWMAGDRAAAATHGRASKRSRNASAPSFPVLKPDPKDKDVWLKAQTLIGTQIFEAPSENAAELPSDGSTSAASASASAASTSSASASASTSASASLVDPNLYVPKLPHGFGACFASLRALYLDKNGLSEKSIPVDFGTRLPFLEKLHLEHNAFRRFPLGLCGEYDSMRFRIARDSGGRVAGDNIDRPDPLSGGGSTGRNKNNSAAVLDKKHHTGSNEVFLPNLRKLYIGNNQMLDIAEGVGNLSQLQILDVHSNQIRRLPPQLALIESLDQLLCHDNPITSPPPFIYSKGTSYMVHRYLREICDSQHTPVPYDPFLFERKVVIGESNSDSSGGGVGSLRDSTDWSLSSGTSSPAADHGSPSSSLSRRQAVGLSKSMSKMSLTKAEAAKVAASLQAKALKEQGKGDGKQRHVDVERSARSLLSKSGIPLALDSERLLYFLVDAGFSALKGRRDYMEDRCIGFPRLRQARPTAVMDEVTGLFSKIGFFGVYDGHGGYRAAEFLTDNLHKLVCNTQAFRDGDFARALEEGFKQADEQFCALCRAHSLLDGSTGVVVLLVDNQLFVAHSGDSRAVLVRDRKAVRLTEDHKPERPDELERIEEAGGEVVYRANCFRVAGDLAMSRSFGDLRLKEPRALVTAQPDVRVEALTPRDTSIIIATDGVWDVISDQKAADIVRKQQSSEEAAEKLTQASIMMGSADNTSAIVINLLWSLDFVSEAVLRGSVEIAEPQGSDKPMAADTSSAAPSSRRKKHDPRLRESALGPMTAEERGLIIQHTLRSSRSIKQLGGGDSVGAGTEDSDCGSSFKEGIFKKIENPASAIMLRVNIPSLEATKLLKFDPHMNVEDILDMLIQKMRFEGTKENWGLFRHIKDGTGEMEKAPLKWARTLRSYNFSTNGEAVDLRELTGHELDDVVDESVLIPESERQQRSRRRKHGRASNRSAASGSAEKTKAKAKPKTSSKPRRSTKEGSTRHPSEKLSETPSPSPSEPRFASAGENLKRRNHGQRSSKDPDHARSSRHKQAHRRRRHQRRQDKERMEPTFTLEAVGEWEVFVHAGDALVSMFGPGSQCKDLDLTRRMGNEKPGQVVIARQEQVLKGEGAPQAPDKMWLCRVVAKNKRVEAGVDTTEVLVNGFLTAGSVVKTVRLKGAEGISRVLVDLLCDLGDSTTMVQFGFDIPDEIAGLKQLQLGLEEMLESAKDARAMLSGRVRRAKQPVQPSINSDSAGTESEPVAEKSGPPDAALGATSDTALSQVEVRQEKLTPLVVVPAGAPPPAVAPAGAPPSTLFGSTLLARGGLSAMPEPSKRTHGSPYANASVVVAALEENSSQTALEELSKRTHVSPYANASAVVAALNARAESTAPADDADGIIADGPNTSEGTNFSLEHAEEADESSKRTHVSPYANTSTVISALAAISGSESASVSEDIKAIAGVESSIEDAKGNTDVDQTDDQSNRSRSRSTSSHSSGSGSSSDSDSDSSSSGSESEDNDDDRNSGSESPSRNNSVSTSASNHESSLSSDSED